MKRLLSILGVALVAACGGNVRQTDVARYDFGSLTGGWSGSSVPIAAVEVQAATWLAGPAMYFRLGYADPLRRRSYAESRWAASPAELLERFLKRRIVFGQTALGGSGCRLQLALDELEQRFDDPQRSQAVLEVRALLLPPRANEILAKKAFSIRKSAATATAAGGAAAARDATQTLADQLGGWLEETVRQKPAIVEHCRTRDTEQE